VDSDETAWVRGILERLAPGYDRVMDFNERLLVLLEHTHSPLVPVRLVQRALDGDIVRHVGTTSSASRSITCGPKFSRSSGWSGSRWGLSSGSPRGSRPDSLP
jgi:hypothetical protein